LPPKSLLSAAATDYYTVMANFGKYLGKYPEFFTINICEINKGYYVRLVQKLVSPYKPRAVFFYFLK
jgi:hypothetical protein